MHEHRYLQTNDGYVLEENCAGCDDFLVAETSPGVWQRAKRYYLHTLEKLYEKEGGPPLGIVRKPPMRAMCWHCYRDTVVEMNRFAVEAREAAQS